jgi:N-acetylneuraminic acid mutarotase
MGGDSRRRREVGFAVAALFVATLFAGALLSRPIDAAGQDGGGSSVPTASPPALPAADGLGLLRVRTDPPVPAKILVDGIPRDEWGLTWLKMDPGGHEVRFGDVYGFGTPPPQTATVLAGEIAEVVGTYERWGSLRVTTDPALPATISIDGVPANDWGVWRSVRPGTYTVSFGLVEGFRTPGAETVSVDPGELVRVVGRYRASRTAPGPDPATYGTLRVRTDPAVPSLISVDGLGRDEWALTWVKLPPGPHTVSFGGVYGHATPGEIAVPIESGGTTEVVGAFGAHGSLRIATSPALPGTILVDGIPRNDWGMWQSMPPGPYEVSFGEVPGFVTPGPRFVTVSAGALTSEVGSYVSEDGWIPASESVSPPARMDHDLVFAGPASRIVTFGGQTDFGTTSFLDDTWSYDPAADLWTDLAPQGSPSPRSGYGLAYDSRSDRVVLFGGATSTGGSGETWIYTPGPGGWTRSTSRTEPSARWGVAMTYDEGSDRVVLFGGRTDAGELDDTWTFDVDANSWAQMRPSEAPSPRFGSAMAYDAASDRSVLFGGTGQGIHNDTWEYDVETDRWIRKAPAVVPRFRFQHAMTYDVVADRVLMYGGATIFTRSPEPIADTWEYDLDSDTWVDLAPAFRPPRLYGHGLAYDPTVDRMFLFGGFTIGTGPLPPSGVLDETWSYDLAGNAWTRVSSPGHPSARWGARMAYDAQSDRMVLFGGRVVTGSSAETWTYDFDTDVWARQAPAASPGTREFADMAYDAESDMIVLFGGSVIGAIFGDTWTYDLDSDRWTLMSPSVAPSVRAGAAMSYDARADRVVLFGGTTPVGPSDETWAYDTNANLWTLRNPSTRPPARHAHGLAYDVQSDRTVLFGGASGSVRFDDTWLYDYGTDRWTRALGGRSPSGRVNFGMAYMGSLDRIVLFGGSDGTTWSDETWWYDVDGDTWTRRSPPTSPSPRSGHAYAYDSGSARIVLFGGVDSSGVFSGETWVYAAALASSASASALPNDATFAPSTGPRLTPGRRT